MSRISRRLVHTVQVEPFTGVNARGNMFGAAVSIRCYVEEVSRLISKESEEQVTAGATGAVSSSTTIYAELDAQPVVPVTSRVTLPSGRVAEVLQVNIFNPGRGMGHLEIHLS